MEILLTAIGGDGDIKEEVIPFWQLAVPYLCLAYTVIVLWIGAVQRVTKHSERQSYPKWFFLIFFLPILGSLYTLFCFRKYDAE